MKENLVIDLRIRVADLKKSPFKGDFAKAIEAVSQYITDLYKSWRYKCTICKNNSKPKDKQYKSLLLVFADDYADELRNPQVVLKMMRFFQDRYDLPCCMDVTANHK